MKNSEVMSQLTESRQSILKLESELEDKDEVLREKFSLINENRELKVRVAAQNERLDLCQQEIDSSRLELRSLEKLMSQMPVSVCEEKCSSLDCCGTEHHLWLLYWLTFFSLSVQPVVPLTLTFLLFYHVLVSEMPYRRTAQNFKRFLLKYYLYIENSFL